MRFIFLALVALMMTACDERYRYPCQDPENWEKKECKKPYCSANGTCPEDLKHYEKNKTEAPKQTTTSVDTKGVCK